jgi:predicted RNase H-like nuclease (RuvC/YqgF family)
LGLRFEAEVKMPKEMDINKVIQGATRQMDLGDLARLGHKRVRVIDEARIKELIAQAVQQAIEAEMQDEGARERRLAAEKSKRELEVKLAESQAQLEKGSLAEREVDTLRGEVARLSNQLTDATQVVETEKRRLAEDSQKEFNKLLASAKAEIAAKSSALEGALRDLLGRAEQAIPREDLAALPKPQQPAAGAAPAAEMLEALSLRLGVLGGLAESYQRDMSSRDQDIALAAAERHRLQNELKSAKEETEKFRQEAYGHQRKLDARDQDVAVAAGETRRVQAEIKTLREELDKRREEIHNFQRQLDLRGQEAGHVGGELKAARDAAERARQELASLQRQLDARDQDVAVAAGEQRKTQAEFKALREEADKHRDEIHNLQRQVDAREHDVMLAAMEQRRVREELNHTREQANRVAELEGEIRRMQSERELLLGQVTEYRQRETAGSEQIAKLSEKISEIKGAVVGGEQIASLKGALGEEIARQIAWAMTSQKTGGVIGVDPGLQLDALFSQKVETNIESVKLEKRSSESIAQKLARLRSSKSTGKETGGGAGAPPPAASGTGEEGKK